MTFVFKHPKYYKELRARNKSDQAISSGSEGSALPQRAPGQGLKQQASSAKTPDPGKSFKHPEPRCSTKIKLLRGCFT